MTRALVTGGAGFIGGHLAKSLLGQNFDVTIADNFSRGRHDAELSALLKSPNAHLIEGDLTDAGVWKTIAGGYDHVYHLASINGTKLFYTVPHEVLRIGIVSTVNVLNWFHTINNVQNAKILYASSNEAYAGALESFGVLPIPTPENVPLVISDTYNPRWSYAGQKLIGELFFIHYAKAYRFRMSIVRPHNFYGPRAGWDHVIPEIIGRAMSKTDPFPLLGTDDTRSFCFIDDAVEAIQMVMESNTTDDGTYHIGTREETIIKDLVEEIFSLMQWHPKKLEAKESPQGSVKRRLADVSKIKNDTGWEARIGLREGLQKTIEWYLNNPKPQ